jgi:hypothetical protein
MANAEWYFKHEKEEDKLWYSIFFAMCRKFGVSWAKATPKQKAFIEEITRVNYEREASKLNLPVKQTVGFFDKKTEAIA